MEAANINKQIIEWEINAYSTTNANNEDNISYFNSVASYNEAFINFLVDFYNLKDKKILDYSCGLGMFTELFSNYSKDISGCDVSKQELTFAREKSNKNIHYFEDDFFNSNLRENCYDFIFYRGLGPLQKMDYTPENSSYLQKMISALRDNGVGYFIIYSNLNGKPWHRLTGVQNYRITTIYDYFQRAGYISMINVFGYQALVITKKEDLAIKYNEKCNYW